MREILRTPLTASSAWKTADFADDESWMYRFTETDLAEIHTATGALRDRGLSPLEFTRADFPLPTLGPKLVDILREIEYGRGFVMLRGLDIGQYDTDGLKLLYWGLGTHLGQVISQNSQGDLLGTVTDMEHGKFSDGGYYEQNVRGHRTNANLEPHSDSSDVVGLLCVHPAKRGGASMICSSMSIYNEVLANHPEFIEPLSVGFNFDLIGKGTKAIETTNSKVPVYSYYQGMLSCRFNKQQIELGAGKCGTPLTKLQQDAIDYVRELSVRDDLLLPIDFQPGDIQLLNNHNTLHARTSYEDHPDPDRKRFLFRLWLNIPNGRPLAPEFADRLNTGGRGGVTKRY